MRGLKRRMCRALALSECQKTALRRRHFLPPTGATSAHASACWLLRRTCICNAPCAFSLTSSSSFLACGTTGGKIALWNDFDSCREVRVGRIRSLHCLVRVSRAPLTSSQANPDCRVVQLKQQSVTATAFSSDGTCGVWRIPLAFVIFCMSSQTGRVAAELCSRMHSPLCLFSTVFSLYVHHLTCDGVCCRDHTCLWGRSWLDFANICRLICVTMHATVVNERMALNLSSYLLEP